MQQDTKAIPLSIVKLLIGFFSQTNIEAEKDALEEWTDNDDNMEVFEECLKIASRPFQYDPERDEEEMALRSAADLFIKHLMHTISPEEKETLDAWLSINDENRKIFCELPQTDDVEVLRNWLREKQKEKQNRIELN
jgi:hypothetical protein